MNKEDSSSWSEIKLLDERLAREPDSFCFARLSDIYLKVGLVADALHTARKGVAKHPGYLAGQRALALACNANGLRGESRSILEQVTAAMPEDTSAQMLLASLCVEAGDKASAIRAYTTLLEFRPDDAESKAQLEELQRDDTGESLQSVPPSEAVVYDETIDEDADEYVYELSEDDIVHDEEEASDMEMEPAAAAVADVFPPVHHDPLSTLTLAELYEQQGFIAKALDIYRIILADDPGNAQLQTRISRLEQQGSEAKDLSEQFEAADVADEPERFASAAFEKMSAPVAAQDFFPLVHNQADNVVEILDNWLENIRRIKACR